MVSIAQAQLAGLQGGTHFDKGVHYPLSKGVLEGTHDLPQHGAHCRVEASAHNKRQHFLLGIPFIPHLPQQHSLSGLELSRHNLVLLGGLREGRGGGVGGMRE